MDSVLSASKEKPVTSLQIMKRLVKKFPNRNRRGMKKTLGQYLPSKLVSKFKLKLRKSTEGWWCESSS